MSLLAGCAAPDARLAVVPDDEPPLFAFAVLSDLHVGEGHASYDGSEDRVTARLRAAVDHVNRLAPERGIELVFVTGDLTDSAERLEFQKARELLDGLAVPYYPVFGNHDVWPYTRDSEAGRARGDRFFHETFAGCFASLESYSGAERVRDPRDGEYKQLQNFVVTWRGVAFVGLDFNTRRAALLTYKGAHPEADVHAYPGGTLPWLRAQLEALPRDTRRVFVFQHHPFRVPWPIPDSVFGFDAQEKASVREALLDAHPASLYGAIFAGHLHRRATTTAFDELPLLAQIETSACKETLDVTVVEVFADGTFRIERTQGIDPTGP